MTLETSRQIAAAPPRLRIVGLDIARGVALLAMASYHFTWDLEFFGFVEPGLTAVGGWKLYARCIASTFLFLAGVSLYLAHGKGIRWAGFWRRFAMVAGAAAAISAVTYFAVPDGFIFFGILHQIALASLLGLLFLRLPSLLTLAIAIPVIAAPFYLRSALFDHSALWWIGLSTNNPRSNDYVPLFPWFGAVLVGIAAANAATATGLLARFGRINPGAWSRPLAFAGRHSLAFYLIHQPLLLGCVWTAAQLFPPPEIPRGTRFTNSCIQSCQQTRDEPFCLRYCSCMLDGLGRGGQLDMMFAGDQSEPLRLAVEEAASVCTQRTDDAILEGGVP